MLQIRVEIWIIYSSMQAVLADLSSIKVLPVLQLALSKESC